jgi:hypothetical protein
MAVYGIPALTIRQDSGREVIRRGKTGVRQHALSLYLQENFRLIDARQSL